MTDGLIVPHITNPRFADDELARPFIPVNLRVGDNEIQELAMIDSGSESTLQSTEQYQID